jgi:predicted DNA-binding transcriptional regulator YafY
MMSDTYKNRITRLTAILTQLQTKRISTAAELAERFAVSTRTIYRDIRTLEQAGIPIVTEDGKGYCIMEHFRLPPVMFTENETNALITAEQLIRKNKDASFVKEYSEAINKIKAVLKLGVKDKVHLLSKRLQIIQNPDNNQTSSNLSTLQLALTNFNLVEITYTDETGNITNRIIEPFAILSTQENWLLLAWCRLRTEFRFFRLDRIKKFKVLPEKFEPHKITLKEYFERYY